ncbi:unnamed protein product (macronuclear) [Paramecium tetraurelia]|uniref:C2H2-type domain-containing protein n=1 Tax=Paramecium tetraurelia TaxID=5888 RepID=A0DG46_PARTE|nr:uncharacterized protein GSPATT00002141001 [Paramecium tetraurelia]CAK82013.1 unnamed protein product [Paramecium tetraurelia]|eukprot:XP_001449410.1 hypothetical protein (macronuclear) [Paramecium tetraurelia strain d4-2]
MKSLESNLICIDKDCKFNRVITNWNELQNHFQYQHKVYTQEKFEKKVNIKLKENNQKLKVSIEQNISEYIAKEEQSINQRIKSLFQLFQNHSIIEFVHLQEQIINNEQIESLSSNNQNDRNLKKYIEIYYNQSGQSNQSLVNTFLEGVKYKLNTITDEILNFIDKLELNHKQESQYSYNDARKPQQEDFFYQNNMQFNFNSNQTYQNQYDYKYVQQQENTDMHQFQQEDPQNKPLRWYKGPSNQQQRPQLYAWEQSQKDYQQGLQLQQEQQQKLEQIYNTKTEAINDNQDRIQFLFPSETTQIKQSNPQKIKVIDTQDLNQEKQDRPNVVELSQNKVKEIQVDQSSQRTKMVGKKFDITNSDKHLKYSQRFTQFSCIQQGVALVEGAFTLNDNAKVKFRFSEPFEKILTASIGMQNVDDQGKKLGTYNLYLEQSGMLYKNEKARQGSLKIELNQEYILQYRAEKRLLSFRKQELSEYLHIEGSTSGSFKFYVKLYGLKVSIIK